MKIRFLLATLLSAVLLTGCSSNEKDGYTEYMEYQQRRFDKMAISYITIDGTLRDEMGSGISGVTVTASSPRYEESSRTANDGFFSVRAKFAAGDIIDFHFHGQGVDWTETLRSVPKGTEKITIRFRRLDSGAVKLGAIEY